jgi:hypothetical protein
MAASVHVTSAGPSGPGATARGERRALPASSVSLLVTGAARAGRNLPEAVK